MGIKKPKKNLIVGKNKLNRINYPVFCFKYLQSVSIENCSNGAFFYNFIARLQKLGDLGWEEIRKSHRHSFGMEKIPIEKIKPQTPLFLTPDVTHLFAFRASGKNHPFLGIQEGVVFHVIFIETNFGDVYAHD